MTGFGEAHRQRDGVAVAVEVRDHQQPLFQAFRADTRTAMGPWSPKSRRWSASRSAVPRCRSTSASNRGRSADDYRIEAEVLDAYRRQLVALQTEWQLSEPRFTRGPVDVARRGSREHDALDGGGRSVANRQRGRRVGAGGGCRRCEPAKAGPWPKTLGPTAARWRRVSVRSKRALPR